MKILQLICCAVLVTACQNSVKKEAETDKSDIQSFIDSGESMPDTGLLTELLAEDSLSEQEKRAIFKTVFGSGIKFMDFKDLKQEKLLTAYEKLLKHSREFSDSSYTQQQFLLELFKSLEIRHEAIKLESEIPVEVQLQIASIKSELHSLAAKSKQKKGGITE